MKRVVIYGSYGYTGNLIAEMSSKLNADVVISGRNSEKLKEQSQRLSIQYMAADLSKKDEMEELLQDADVVIHCAGPFVHTYKPMVEACVRNTCHYLDITGEINVFEGLKSMDEKFKKAGVMAMPGVGFDVVPTDCMAAWLYQQLPDATSLELAFKGHGGGVSRGTAKTMIENLGEGGAIRKNGKIIKVPAAYKTRTINIKGEDFRVVSIPWGDVSTAYFSTGIENIIVYTALPGRVIKKMKWLSFINPILKLNFVKQYLKRNVDKRRPGPSAEKRKTGRSYIWGEVKNENGKTVEGKMEVGEGYGLTTEMSLIIADNVLNEDYKSGYQTPSKVYGADLILRAKNSIRLNN